MHAYRTHTCGQLTAKEVGQTVKLSGWVHRIRDHGQLCFLDLRDHYGVTQGVAQQGADIFDKLTKLKNESVVTIVGELVKRSAETVNKELPTGEVEVVI